MTAQLVSGQLATQHKHVNYLLNKNMDRPGTLVNSGMFLPKALVSLSSAGACHVSSNSWLPGKKLEKFSPAYKHEEYLSRFWSLAYTSGALEAGGRVCFQKTPWLESSQLNLF